MCYLAFLLCAALNVAQATAEKVFPSNLSEDPYETMQIFHEQISILDFAEAIELLDANLHQDENSKNKAVAYGLKGI